MRTRQAWQLPHVAQGDLAALRFLAANVYDRRQTHPYFAFDWFFRAKIKATLAIALSVRAAKFLRAARRPELQNATALAALVNSRLLT
jgi:hypothetical protein